MFSFSFFVVRVFQVDNVQYPACIIPFGRADEVADAGFVRDVEYVPECMSSICFTCVNLLMLIMCRYS